MKFLFLDTSTSSGVVGLFSDETLIQKRQFVAAFTNSKLLMPTVYEMVSEPKTLQAVAVGIGPGSYTGIRVAVATAKGISFALRVPLVGVSSLKGFIPELPHDGRFIAAIDAKSGGIYAVEGQRSGEKVTFFSDEKLMSVEEFRAAQFQATCIVTPIGGAEAIRNRLPEVTAHIFEREPAVEFLGKLAFQALQRKEGVMDGNLPLLYLRKTQAEIEKDL